MVQSSHNRNAIQTGTFGSYPILTADEFPIDDEGNVEYLDNYFANLWYDAVSGAGCSDNDYLLTTKGIFKDATALNMLNYAP